MNVDIVLHVTAVACACEGIPCASNRSPCTCNTYRVATQKLWRACTYYAECETNMLRMYFLQRVASFPVCRKYESLRAHWSNLVRQMCSETNMLLHRFLGRVVRVADFYLVISLRWVQSPGIFMSYVRLFISYVRLFISYV